MQRARHGPLHIVGHVEMSFFFLSHSLASIVLPLLLFRSHIRREFRILACLCWLGRTNEHNALLLGIRHSLHVLVGERLFIVGGKSLHCWVPGSHVYAVYSPSTCYS